MTTREPFDVKHVSESKADEKLKSKIAWKIMDGYRLGPEEFEKAKEWGLLLGKETYGEYVSLCYEDEFHRGWLCPEPSYKGMTESADGTLKIDACSYGLHAYQVNKEYLTPYQLEWFKQHGWTEDQIGSGNSHQLPNKRLGEYLKNFKMSDKWRESIEIEAKSDYVQYNYEYAYLKGKQPLRWMVELIHASELRGDKLKHALEYVDGSREVRLHEELQRKGKELRCELARLNYLTQEP